MITELLSNHSKFYLIFFLVGVFFRLKKTIWLNLTVLLKIPASVTVYRGSCIQQGQLVHLLNRFWHTTNAAI